MCRIYYRSKNWIVHKIELKWEKIDWWEIEKIIRSKKGKFLFAVHYWKC